MTEDLIGYPSFVNFVFALKLEKFKGNHLSHFFLGGVTDKTITMQLHCIYKVQNAIWFTVCVLNILKRAEVSGIIVTETAVCQINDCILLNKDSKLCTNWGYQVSCYAQHFWQTLLLKAKKKKKRKKYKKKHSGQHNVQFDVHVQEKLCTQSRFGRNQLKNLTTVFYKVKLQLSLFNLK